MAKEAKGADVKRLLGSPETERKGLLLSAVLNEITVDNATVYNACLIVRAPQEPEGIAVVEKPAADFGKGVSHFQKLLKLI